jgi:hypothetical protein
VTGQAAASGTVRGGLNVGYIGEEDARLGQWKYLEDKEKARAVVRPGLFPDL